MKKSHSIWVLAGAYLLYVLLAFLPPVTAVALDWSTYTATPERCVSIGAAGVIGVALIVLQALGHSPKKVKRVVWYSVFASVLWAMQPIIAQLAVLVTCMACGEWAALLIAAPLIRKVRQNRQDAHTAEVMAEAMRHVEGRV